MMKNLLLLGLAFTASVGAADAQKANLRGKKLVAVSTSPMMLDGDAYFSGSRTPSAPSKNKKVSAGGVWGTQIGKTFYDLPSNAATANRIVRNADGTISASWTETCLGNGAPTGFPTRGAGYNYFDGTSWIHGATGTCSFPTAQSDFGIASKRVGWPEVVILPSGQEMVFTHNSNAINVTQRPAKGTGGMTSWSATTDLGFTQNIQNVTGNAGTWPRVINNGNNIHMIYSINNTPVPKINGVTGLMVYSRSTDGGVTWDQQNVILPGLRGVDAADPTSFSSESFNRIGGDGYAIAVNGNNVAIVTGSGGEPWTLWKSTDNGTTFTRRLIKTVMPADTIYVNSAADTAAIVNDGAHAVVIDNLGKVHVWAGMVLSKINVKTAPGGGKYFRSTGSTYNTQVPGLLYWNDAMPAVIDSTEQLVIAGVEDSKPAGHPDNWIANGAGPPSKFFPYSGLGLVSMASAAVDMDNNVYVVYSGVVEGTSNSGTITGQPFRDLYIMRRHSRNGVWTQPVNIARSLNVIIGQPGASPAENLEENVFPSVAHTVGADNLVHIMWQQDYEPGMNLGSDGDDELENNIMYYAYNGAILGTKEEAATYVNKISAYPNPTANNVTINVDLKKNANVSVKVTNIMGQEVANFAPKQMAAGNTAVKVDMNGLASGVYLYTVTSDNFTVTNRIVKQ